MKKFIQGFKEFAIQGNVIDMAVGVIIGAAFKAIVDSLVADIISPIIGAFTGQDFSEKTFTIGGVQFGYGSFIMAVVNFIIIALILYIILSSFIKARETAEKLLNKEKEEVQTTKTCPFCKSEISIEATRCPHCTSQLEDIGA